MSKSILILFALLAAIAALPAAAQDANLLHMPGFDDGYSSRGRADLNLPRFWGLRLDVPPDHPDWQDHIFAFPHRTPPEVHGGSASLNLSGGYIAFTAAVYQQVPVERGALLRASAWAWLHACNLPRDRDDNIVGGICDSSPDSGAVVRVGLDPNGGSDPKADDIVWSDDATPHDRWEQIGVETTATGSVVTVFLSASQEEPTDLNKVYWDDAALVVVDGSASATATPPLSLIGPVSTATPDAGPAATATVSAGSGTYVVRAGDTFDLIALRHGLSRANLLALNPGVDSRQLRVGQPLNVGAAN